MPNVLMACHMQQAYNRPTTHLRLSYMSEKNVVAFLNAVTIVSHVVGQLVGLS